MNIAGTRASSTTLREHLRLRAPVVTVTREGATRFASSQPRRGAPCPAPLNGASADTPLRVEEFPPRTARDRISLTPAPARRRDPAPPAGRAMVVQRAAVAFSAPGQELELPQRPGTRVYGTLRARLRSLSRSPRPARADSSRRRLTCASACSTLSASG
jgi:hypothetical protein